MIDVFEMQRNAFDRAIGVFSPKRGLDLKHQVANRADGARDSMFVVKTLTPEPIYKAFGTSRAAQRWAENDAHLEHEAQQCQIYRTISGLNPMQAIAAVKMGKAERLLTVRRRGDVD
jgi:hypothetical protein